MAPSPEDRQRIAAAAFSLPDVSDRRMFGADVYMVRGRMFAFLEAESLGIKLPPQDRQRLLDDGAARPYQMPQGRRFGDWLALPLRTPAELERALGLLATAGGYVRERSAGLSPRRPHKASQRRRR